MKKLLIALLGVVVITSNAWGISLVGSSQVYMTSRVESDLSDGSSTHVHVATTPVKVYEIVVTPTKTGGYAQLFDTKSAAANDDQYVKGSTTRVLADVQGATANSAIHISWKNGIGADRLFVDTYNARAEIYYNE